MGAKGEWGVQRAQQDALRSRWCGTLCVVTVLTGLSLWAVSVFPELSMKAQGRACTPGRGGSSGRGGPSWRNSLEPVPPVAEDHPVEADHPVEVDC